MLNPYLDESAGVLFNKLGINNPQKLKEAEDELTRLRLSQLTARPIPGNFDLSHLQAIHRHIFQDVYPWAGQFRQNYDAVKLDYVGGPARRFTPSAEIERECKALFTSLSQDDYLKNLAREPFLEKTACYLNRMNAIHPFPEGNGRAQRRFISLLAEQAGHPLDFSVISQDRMIEASIAGIQGDDVPMTRLLDDAADPQKTLQLRRVIDFLEQHRNVLDWNNVYLATTVPGQTYSGSLVSRGGNDFLFREDRNQVLVGHRADVPLHINGGDHFTFTASDGQRIEKSHHAIQELAEQAVRKGERFRDGFPVVGSDLIPGEKTEGMVLGHTPHHVAIQTDGNSYIIAERARLTRELHVGETISVHASEVSLRVLERQKGLERAQGEVLGGRANEAGADGGEAGGSHAVSMLERTRQGRDEEERESARPLSMLERTRKTRGIEF